MGKGRMMAPSGVDALVWMLKFYTSKRQMPHTPFLVLVSRGNL